MARHVLFAEGTASRHRPLIRPGLTGPYNGAVRFPRALRRCVVLALAAWLGGSLSAQTPVPGAASPAAAAGDRIFQLTKVHKLYVSLSAAEWAVLQTSAGSGGIARGGTDYTQPDGRLIHTGSGFGGYFPWAHADLRVEGTEFKNVGLRYKGNLSFRTSSAAAPLFANFKLKIDVYGAKGSWDGEKTFNLHAGVVDTSKTREAIAFTAFRAAGVPAPRTAYAELFVTVPGLYQDTPAGLFTLIENVNERFLERVLKPGTGLLMKPEGLRGGIVSYGDSWASYAALRPDREATPHEQQRVIEFAKLISQPDVATFRANIAKYLDVDLFLRFLAVNAIILNTDSYLGGSHNFYLYLDPSDDKFRFIPWDQDLAMGPRGTMGGGGLGNIDILTPYRGDQPLIYWLLDDPAVAARYHVILRELSRTVFTPDFLKIVDELERVGAARSLSPRAFLQGRISYLQQIVSSWDR